MNVLKHIEVLLDDVFKYGAREKLSRYYHEASEELMDIVSMDNVEGMSYILEMAADVLNHVWLSHDLEQNIRDRLDNKIMQMSWMLEDAMRMWEVQYPERIMRVRERLEYIMIEKEMLNPYDEDDE